jgi:hypothetical protein
MKRIKTWIVKRRNALMHVLILLVIFSVSISVRYKHFNHSLSRNHEWLTAHSLIIMKIWDKGGISNYHFSPIYTFPGKSNDDDYTICSLHDELGDGYYVSYGPFSSLLPYAIFKTCMIPIGLPAITGFNLLVHFLVSLFLYLLVLRIANKKFGEFSVAALSVFIMYTFSPGTLWYHGNIYFSEILAQLFLSAGMYVFYIVLEQSATKRSALIWYGILCFFGIYNEWLGLFFTFVTGTFFLIKTVKHRQFLKPFLIALCCGIGSIALLVYQYSSIAGFDRLIEVETAKLAERNGGGLVSGYQAAEQFSISSPESYKHIEYFFNTNFLNVINSLAFLIPVFIVLVCYRRTYFFNKKHLLLLALIALTVALHHLVFFNFTASHDFSTLKTGYLLIFLIGLMLIRLEEFSTTKKWLRPLIASLVLVFFTVKSYESFKQYDYANTLNGVYNVYEKAGTDIKNLSHPGNEIVFTNTLVSPDLVVYAECNARFSLNRMDALNMASIKKMTAAYFYVLNERVVSITRYQPNGDSVRTEIQPVK